MTVRTFIDRPVLAGVISVLIVILGILGLMQLPIEQFPNIAPPTVRVSATYTGANAETVMKSVIVPLEESLNGVEDMMYMTSTATNTGTASISIYFRQGTGHYNTHGVWHIVFFECIGNVLFGDYAAACNISVGNVFLYGFFRILFTFSRQCYGSFLIFRFRQDFVKILSAV